jgi:tRNA-specific 2-thiouridylase
LQRLEKKEGAILFFSGEEAPEAGKKVWTHPGAYFYTIGQSHGLGLHFKAYVARIDVARNILYVTDKDHRTLTSQTLIAKNWHRINPEKKAAYQKGSPHHPTSSGKIRYRQNPPVPCTLEEGPEGTMKVTFDEAQRAIAPGQIFVAYQGELCLWCGTIV